MRKERLTTSIDPALAAGARAAVKEGRAESLSALVNVALKRQLDYDRKLKNLEDFVREYEQEHGEITEKEMRLASREAAGRAVVVRGRSPITGSA